MPGLQHDSAESEARALYQQEGEDLNKLRHNALLVPTLETENSRDLIIPFNGPGVLSQVRDFPIILPSFSGFGTPQPSPVRTERSLFASLLTRRGCVSEFQYSSIHKEVVDMRFY